MTDQERPDVEVAARNGAVRVTIRLEGFVPEATEPTSTPGLFNEIISPADARAWADATAPSEFADALRAAANCAEDDQRDDAR